MVDIRKLSVGDQVMVCPDLKVKDYDNVSAVGVMLDYRGKIFTVSEIVLNTGDYGWGENADVALFEEDEYKCGWSGGMLEPVDNVSLMDMLAENNI